MRTLLCAASAGLLCGFAPLRAQSWTVTAPQAMSLEHGQRIPLQIATSKALRGLHVVGVKLQDASSLDVVDPDSVRLSAQGKCVDVANYDPARDRPLSLCIKARRSGSYVGAVSIAADTGAVVTIPLTVHASSRTRRFWGVGAILLGVALSWLVTVLLRRVGVHLEAKLPAAQLRDQLVRLEGRLQSAADAIKSGKLPQLESGLAREKAQLLPARLKEVGLPAVLTSSFTPNPAVPASYADHLKSVGERVGVLETLVTGVEKAATLQGQHVNDQRRKDAAIGIDACEALRSVTLAEATTCVKEKLEAMLAPPISAQHAPAGVAPPQQLIATRDLYLVQYALNGTSWILWALLTVFVGWVALVATNPGFGTPSDFIKCALWGLGVPMAGQQLQQLSPSVVNSSVGLSLPRA